MLMQEFHNHFRARYPKRVSTRWDLIENGPFIEFLRNMYDDPGEIPRILATRRILVGMLPAIESRTYAYDGIAHIPLKPIFEDILMCVLEYGFPTDLYKQ